jgi:YHS domain-containing protein
MNVFCKLLGTGTILLAAVGCGTDESAQNAPGGAPAPIPPGGATPIGGPAAGKAPAPNAAPETSQPEGKGSEGPKVEGPKSEGTKPGGDQASAGSKAFTDDELAAIKELPAEEQSVAIKQVSCPVSGDHLGSMGKPYKTSAQGQTFYLCCKSCQDKVKADPAGVLAKLNKP